jgi:hypothetical protein
MTGRRRNSLPARGDDLLRQRIVQEAARIMAEEGVQDFAAAKRKAAARLNQAENRHLPSNREIESALADYLRLFHARDLPHTLRQLLNVALDAMHLVARFDPRLTGPLLSGVATAYSAVPLQVFPDDPEQVAVLLHEHGIPFEQDRRRMRFGGDRQEEVPLFRFVAGDTPVEISVLPPQGLREAPLSPVDARPMKRANLKEVERLYADVAVHGDTPP